MLDENVTAKWTYKVWECLVGEGHHWCGVIRASSLGRGKLAKAAKRNQRSGGRALEASSRSEPSVQTAGGGRGLSLVMTGETAREDWGPDNMGHVGHLERCLALLWMKENLEILEWRRIWSDFIVLKGSLWLLCASSKSFTSAFYWKKKLYCHPQQWSIISLSTTAIVWSLTLEELTTYSKPSHVPVPCIGLLRNGQILLSPWTSFLHSLWWDETLAWFSYRWLSKACGNRLL